MPALSPAASRYCVRVLAGFAILSVEAFAIRSTGIKEDIWGAGSILAGGNQFFRLFILPFLLTLLYVVVFRFRAAQYRGLLPSRPAWKSIAAHAISLAGFLLLTLYLRQAHGSAILAGAWFFAGTVTATTGILATFDPAVISRTARGAALLVLAFAAVSLVAMPVAERSWDHDSNVTVDAATALLRHVGFDVRADGKRIRTPHFAVVITPACSGYEGICLFLVFAIAWLAWFRKEYRFPAALLVLPVGVAISWCLNVVRIAGYVLIGHFGHKDVAMNGFHSWAGLIAFTCLAVCFCSVSPRVPGISRLPAASSAPAKVHDPIVAYLGPFLAMQAASMIARAASGGFEWLYPLRVLAAAAVIWPYRKDYAAIDWGRRPSLFAVGAGVLTAALWIASAWRFPVSAGPWSHLSHASLAWRLAWLSFRACGGVLVAPFVEELAFRGFLMRRMQAAEFAAVDARKCGWRAIGVSSLVFGLLHGPRFVEGSIAGAFYGYSYARTGKLGDAFVAHGLTNLILAAVVAGTGDWRYW